MSVHADWAIEAELLGRNSGWIDITADVRADSNIDLSYGIRGSGVQDRVATTGTLQFVLDNGPTNSGHTIGYYSPAHANCRPGFTLGMRVRLKITYAPVGSSYRFVGSIDKVTPQAGVRGGYTSDCIAVDWMDEAARYQVSGIGIQLNKRADEIMTTLVETIHTQPSGFHVINPGVDTFPYSLDNVQDESTTALSIFQNIAMSGLDLIYLKSDQVQGGLLYYEPRSYRASITSNMQNFENTMDDVVAVTTRANIINKVQVEVHPRKVDSTDDVVLFTLDSAVTIGPNSFAILTLPLRDPNQLAQRAGGTDFRTLIPGAAGIGDYTLNTMDDGSGTDITASAVVERISGESSSNSITLKVTNTSGSSGFVTFLQQKGRGIYDYNTVVLKQSLDTLISLYGQRGVTINMPFQVDAEVGGQVGAYILTLYSGLKLNITKLTILGNWSDALMTAVLLRDISDRIGVVETVTGVSLMRAYFINGIDLTISRGRKFVMSFVLTPADTTVYWELETVGRGELDSTTIPGFGSILGI